MYVSSNTSQRLARLRLVFSRWRALAPEEQATWAAEAAAASVCVRGWGGGEGQVSGRQQMDVGLQDGTSTCSSCAAGCQHTLCHHAAAVLLPTHWSQALSLEQTAQAVAAMLGLSLPTPPTHHNPWPSTSPYPPNRHVATAAAALAALLTAAEAAAGGSKKAAKRAAAAAALPAGLAAHVVGDAAEALLGGAAAGPGPKRAAKPDGWHYTPMPVGKGAGRDQDGDKKKAFKEVRAARGGGVGRGWVVWVWDKAERGMGRSRTWITTATCACLLLLASAGAACLHAPDPQLSAGGAAAAT